MAAFRTAILPLVDYLIFDLWSQLQNKRNTVRYSKDQSTQLLEDALNVYVTYSKRLKWSELFKLIRKLLHKIEKASRKSTELAAVKQDKEVEKTITKCLCKVLEGFAESSEILIDDAVDVLANKAEGAKGDLGVVNAAKSDKSQNEFSALLEEFANKANE